ncbi:MAG TPA: ABC transporter ATP-binding protein [Thermodesulfobacteriota bacterium]
MTTPILEIKGLTRRFGGLVAVDRVDFTLPGGELHAIIGPNGAGKTTLFNLISGFLRADAGRVIFRGQDILGRPPHEISRAGIARTLQVKSVFGGLTVFDNVWIAAEAQKPYLHPLRPMRRSTDTAKWVEALLEDMGLTPYAHELAGNLSYGDVALLEIAIALAMKPRLLLLDEPVSGMSPSETKRTAAKIRELSRSVDIILVEHDMEVVFEIADVITVMNQGAVLCQGPPEAIARDPRVQEAYLGAAEDDADAAGGTRAPA